jgi:exo-beta-1,3-glucanase (GH17 family)
VTRVVQFGSEPLFDNVITPTDLAHEIISAKAELASIGVPITVSELAYGYKERGGAQNVLDAVDSFNIHMLPFFQTEATSGSAAWPLVIADLSWFIENGNGKKMYLDEVRCYSLLIVTISMCPAEWLALGCLGGRTG